MPEINNFRVRHKNDIEANWMKAKAFIPLKGEIIVYNAEVDGDTLPNKVSSKDTDYPNTRNTKITYQRFKIGDGKTNVNALPFQNGGIIIEGNGNNSIVIGDAEANGEFSIAGGTDASSIAESFGVTANIGKPVAEGDISLSFGAGTKTLTMGTTAMGVNSIAGCKGFYFWKITFNTNPIIQLSTTQKKNILSSRKWSSSGTEATQLAKLAVGDMISIVNSTKYTLCSKITAIDTTNGTITVDHLPFTSVDESILGLSILFDDYSVTCPSKPECGVVELGYGAMAFGLQNKSTGSFSHSEGWNNLSAGDFAHTEGRDNIAGYAAHAEGVGTTATGLYAHSEGSYTRATGDFSHAEGESTEATREHAHAEGNSTKASGVTSHAEGTQTNASGKSSHAEGTLSIATKENAHAEGTQTEAKGKSSHAEGTMSKASAENAHAEGSSSTASGSASHAEGYLTTASGNYAHAEGMGTNASSNYTHAEGSYTKATADFAHAEGELTEASGTHSHVEGLSSKAIGNYSHAEGWLTTANGTASHAAGQGTIADGNSQTVVGKYNNSDSSALFIVGGGTGTNGRANSFTVYAAGDSRGVTIPKTGNDEKSVTNKKYVDDKVNGKMDKFGEVSDNKVIVSDRFELKTDGRLSITSGEGGFHLTSQDSPLFLNANSIQVFGADGESVGKISNLAMPVNNDDAVNKAYVDSEIKNLSRVSTTKSFMSPGSISITNAIETPYDVKLRIVPLQELELLTTKDLSSNNIITVNKDDNTITFSNSTDGRKIISDQIQNLFPGTSVVAGDVIEITGTYIMDPNANISNDDAEMQVGLIKPNGTQMGAKNIAPGESFTFSYTAGGAGAAEGCVFFYTYSNLHKPIIKNLKVKLKYSKIMTNFNNVDAYYCSNASNATTIRSANIDSDGWVTTSLVGVSSNISLSVWQNGIKINSARVDVMYDTSKNLSEQIDSKFSDFAAYVDSKFIYDSEYASWKYFNIGPLKQAYQKIKYSFVPDGNSIPILECLSPYLFDMNKSVVNITLEVPQASGDACIGYQFFKNNEDGVMYIKFYSLQGTTNAAQVTVYAHVTVTETL